MPKKEILKSEDTQKIIDRLEAYLALTGKNKAQMSDELGFSKDYITHLIRKRRLPKSTASYFNKIFKEYGLEAIDEKVNELLLEKRTKETIEKMQYQQVQLFQESPCNFNEVIEHIQILEQKLDKVLFQLLQIAGLAEGFVETFAYELSKQNTQDSDESDE